MRKGVGIFGYSMTIHAIHAPTATVVTAQAMTRRRGLAHRARRKRRRSPWLVSRHVSLVAFGPRCIPPGGVAPPANTPCILGRRALPCGRIAALDANKTYVTKH